MYPVLVGTKVVVRNTVSAKVASAGSSVKNFILGEKSTFKTTDDVLRAEYEAIWGGTPPSGEVAYRRAVQERGQAALCLSGGGIRSAAFSLGVLQVLAYRGLLTQFQYLSTVSGGGYIGGWLSRWIAEDPQQDAVNIENVLARRDEILQVASLRANSNFLTPKTGITSADTWTGILLWVRNVLLNWTVFIPALIFAVLAPNLYLALMTWFATLAGTRTALFGVDLAVVLLWIASVSLTIATWRAARNMPSHRNGDDPSSTAIAWQIVLPLLLWAWLVPFVLVTGSYKVKPDVTFSMFGASEPILFWLIVFSFSAKIVGYVIACITNRRNFFLYLRNIPTWVIVSAIATGALWLAITVIDYLSTLLPAKDHLLMSVGANLEQVAAIVFALSILGPLGATLAHLLLSTLYVGFRYADFQDDADREWLARVSAVSVFPALLWALFALICLFLPFVFFDNEWLWKLAPTLGPTIDRLVKALGVISGFVAVLGGKNSSLKLDISNTTPMSGSTKAYELVVRLATLFFIAFLFMVLAYVERMTAEKLISNAQAHGELSAIVVFVIPRVLVFLTGFVPIYLIWYFASRETLALQVAVLILAFFSVIELLPHAMSVWVTDPAHSAAKKVLMAQGLIAAGLFLIISVASMKIDVNRFSMHGVYRNRLVRAFLGGARAGRKADRFTNFDPADNGRVSELKAQKNDRRVLYPVINVTLNMVGGENLAWQERKASSFIVTPLYCGSAVLGSEVTGYAAANNPRKWTGAYVETQDYGGKEPDLNDNKTGISLGTAITISGAAASPSMGYSSTPATAFLMTLFNVRLGAWLANPAAGIRKEQVQAGPTSALRPLLTEALGQTDARSANVYLSDGGHFDNLGIYEMIRRRCRYILVVDADADEKFAFEDLARSVRFAAIDLDAKIEFESIKMKNVQEATATSDTFAIGKIIYAENRAADVSWLIYIKPTYFYENAPVDVRSYGRVNTTFPHETTLDQWFGESQFESYRRLGEYLMSKLYEEQLPKIMPKLAAGTVRGHTLAQFFNAVTSPAPPPGPSPLLTNTPTFVGP